jgi:hypothetical protein
MLDILMKRYHTFPDLQVVDSLVGEINAPDAYLSLLFTAAAAAPSLAMPLLFPEGMVEKPDGSSQYDGSNDHVGYSHVTLPVPGNVPPGR